MALEVVNKTYLKMTEEQLKESDMWSFGMYSNIFFFFDSSIYFMFFDIICII